MISIMYDELKREFNDQTMQGIYETEVVLGQPLDVWVVEHGRDVEKIPVDLQRKLTSVERNMVHSLIGDQKACAVYGKLVKAKVLTETKGKRVLTKIKYDVVLENNKVINPYFVQMHTVHPDFDEITSLETTADATEYLCYIEHEMGISEAKRIFNELEMELLNLD